MKYIKNNLLISVGVLVVLALGLAAGLLLVRQSQDVREKAQAGGVSASLSPQSATLNNGETKSISVVLTNPTGNALQVLTAGVDITFDTSLLTAGGVSCNGSFLPNQIVASVSDNKIYLSCSITPGGSGKTIAAGGQETLGTFNITGKALGSAQLSFSRVVVSDGSSDISSGSGTGGTYTIQAGTGGTTVPTATAGPTSPPAGTPNPCGGTCGSNSNCQSGLFCFSGFCRNPSCPVVSNCNCSAGGTGTPKATAKPKATVKGSPTGTPEAITIVETPSPTPFSTASPEPRGGGIFNNIFLWIAGGALLLLIILYFLFGRNSDDNPPQITPPTSGGGQEPSTDTVHTTSQSGKPEEGINLGQNVTPPPPPPQQTPPQQG